MTDLLQGNVDRSGVVPLYQQLEAILLAESGRSWHEGELLPSDAQLCARYGVSRTVVRQALAELGRAGMIYRLKGKGTYATARKIESTHVQDAAGFFASMTRAGHTVISRVLRQEVIPATASIARALGLRVSEPVIAVTRVRRVDGVPLSVVRSWLPYSLCPGLEAVDLTAVSMYAAIHERFGFVPGHGRRTIEAMGISAEDAVLLEVPVGSPALRLESVMRTQEDVLLETFVAVYRGDLSKLEVEVVSRASLGSGEYGIPRAGAGDRADRENGTTNGT